MSAYAKQNNLSIKAFYHARTLLVNLRSLPAKVSTQLISVTAKAEPAAPLSSCRVTLINGVTLDLSEVDMSSLIDKVNQL